MQLPSPDFIKILPLVLSLVFVVVRYYLQRGRRRLVVEDEIRISIRRVRKEDDAGS